MAADPLARAVSLLSAGQAAQANALLEPLCARDTSDARAWFLLGASRHALRALDGALAAFDRVLALAPEDLQATQAALAVLCEAGRAAEALRRARAALTRWPEDAQLHFNAGVVHEAADDPAGALDCYDRTLALDPSFTPALQNRGIVLTRLGRVADALENNRRLAASSPGSAEAHYNLAETCLAARCYDEAAAAARRALVLAPGHAGARLDLGLTLAANGQLDQARPELERAVSSRDPVVVRRIETWAAEAGLDPGEAAVQLQPEDVFLVMGYERLERCDWNEYAGFVDRCGALIRGAQALGLRSRSLAFKLLHLPLPGALQRTVADRVAAGLTGAPRAIAMPAPRSRAPGDRLRVGYLSADFGNHPVGHLTRSMYALHDRSRFEIYGYALAGDDGSDNFRTIARGCDVMRDVRALPLDRLVGQIADDAIDILVDLGGYTRAGRPEVLARRPAPVRVSYLGYPATLGGALADYMITDATAVPPGADALYSEKLVRLPHCYIVASHRDYRAEDAPTRSEQGLPEEAVVFCAFHRHEKIEPRAFSAACASCVRRPKASCGCSRGREKRTSGSTPGTPASARSGSCSPRRVRSTRRTSLASVSPICSSTHAGGTPTRLRWTRFGAASRS